jgi:Transglutaminase-like superfamily
MKGLTVTLALGVVLAITSGAVAGQAPPERPHIMHLKQTVHRLRQELRDTRHARDNARTALAAANAKLRRQSARLAAQSQEIAALTSQVSTLTAQRNAAQAQAANLQAKLNAIPTPLAVAVQQVDNEAAWAAQEDTRYGIPYSAGTLASVAATNYVVGHVSTGEFGFLELENLPLPQATPDSILGAQAGICGHAALTFAAIIKRLGFPVRSVQFYYSTPQGDPDSHIADEVYYDDGWHFFDPTFGTFWTDAAGQVLSISDVRAQGGIEQKDSASFTNFVENAWYVGDDTAFLTDPTTTVVLDGQPFTG